jgi:magnesium-transporting ATPase (P-type)
VATLEFSRKRKGMSVLSADNKGDRSLFIKGAPEYLIK